MNWCHFQGCEKHSWDPNISDRRHHGTFFRHYHLLIYFLHQTYTSPKKFELFWFSSRVLNPQWGGNNLLCSQNNCIQDEEKNKTSSGSRWIFNLIRLSSSFSSSHDIIITVCANLYIVHVIITNRGFTFYLFLSLNLYLGIQSQPMKMLAIFGNTNTVLVTVFHQFILYIIIIQIQYSNFSTRC